MARTKKEYESKATTTKITASGRRSIGIQNRTSTEYYTIEYTEERSIPEDADIEKERTFLWDACNEEVDNQISDILEIYKTKKG